MSSFGQNLKNLEETLLEQLPKEVEVTYSRSSGPGGQNVNKVNSKVTLKFDLSQNLFLNQEVKDRIMLRFGNRIVEGGIIQVSSDLYRDQGRNYSDALMKIINMIKDSWFPPKIRRKTRPTFSSQKKRVDQKRNRGETKSSRRKVDYD